ncbi:mechanosensitive ion channel family protein [Ponticoccus sp. (in: a-proteobacteria)]|uniref:mechanosensitive ion channel family protein n=1 Tax=Ponticoccus sp. (in: a-proteobacteria) TaxID=1925025 RepID=UPI003AB25AA4
MRLVSHLRRLFWPSLLLFFAAGMVIFDQAVERRVGVSLRLMGGIVCWLAAAWIGSRLFGLFADRRRRHKRPYPRLFRDLVTVLLFFAALVASAALLLDRGLLGALAGSSLILAVLGFAIRNVVADTLSGIALGIEAPYRIGDWVDIEQVTKGKVIEIGWRTTRVLTLDSTYMIMPNSQIARRRIINYSAPKPQYRAQLSLKLAQEVPVETAKALILKAVGEARLIQADPAPDVRVQELGSDSNSYAVRFWLSRFERDADCRDELLSLIDRALRQAKVPMPRMQIELARPGGKTMPPYDHEAELARIFPTPPGTARIEA